MLVTIFLTRLERCFLLLATTPFVPYLFRCLRYLRVWCIYAVTWLVLGEVASLLRTSQHSGQGACAYSNCSCSVGSTVGWAALYLLSFKQRGSCGHLGKGCSTDRLLMRLLRCLLFYAVYFTFHIHSEHIPGIMNVATDALSRSNLLLFSSLGPQTPQIQVPQSVSCLLLTQMPNWGSVTWTELFKTSLTEALHNPR